jgi:hypothetical protein
MSTLLSKQRLLARSNRVAELATGIEPTTTSLQNWCSTIELRQLRLSQPVPRHRPRPSSEVLSLLGKQGATPRPAGNREGALCMPGSRICQGCGDEDGGDDARPRRQRASVGEQSSHLWGANQPEREAAKRMRQIPKSADGWLKELVAAYADAREAVPFGALVGADMRLRLLPG